MSLESAGDGQPRDTKAKALLIAWLKKSERSAEELSGAFGQYVEADRVIASHPNASADLLEKLSHSTDKSTRRRVVGNPNTPAEVYVHLGQQFPREFLANPALDLLLIVNPGLMEEVPEALLIRLLKHADCPSSLLAWAAGHSQAKVQLAVLMNAKAPEEALEKLRVSDHIFVRESVGLQTKFAGEIDPEAAFEQAVRDRLASLSMKELDEAWSAGDIGLAQWEALPLCFRLAKAIPPSGISPEAIARILTDTNWTIEAVREALPNFDGWAKVARIQSLPATLLKRLAVDSDAWTRRNTAINHFTPISVLESLSVDSDVGVREWIARNPKTPEKVLETLAKDVADVRIAVARNQSVSLSVLEMLASDLDIYVRRSIAQNVITPLSLLEKLASDHSKLVRAAVASNKLLSSEVCKVLAKDLDAEVRRELARNTSTPAEVLLDLSKDLDEGVRREVAGNTSAPDQGLFYLSKDSAISVKYELSRNPITPFELTDTFEIRDLQALSVNQRIPETLFYELAKHPDYSVRKSVAKNPQLPQEIVAAMSRDKSFRVRESIAANPISPAEVLEELLLDRSKRVSEKAVKNPNTPWGGLMGWMSSATVSASVRLDLIQKKRLDGPTLQKMMQRSVTEGDLQSLLEHPNLDKQSAQTIANKLLSTPAVEGLWYQQELDKTNLEEVEAVKAGSMFRYSGRDPNRAVLAKRPLASLMALSAGSFVEPRRIVRGARSPDWLVRAATARNLGTPANLLKRLTSDVNPLVASLSKLSLHRMQVWTVEETESNKQPIRIYRVVEEVRKRATRAPNPLDFAFDPVWNRHIHVSDFLEIVGKMGGQFLGEVLLKFLEHINENDRPKVLIDITKISNRYALSEVASLSECPKDLLLELAKQADPRVLISLYKNTSTSSDVRIMAVKSMLRLRGQKRVDLAAENDLPEVVIERLELDVDHRVQESLAKNVHTQSEILDRLAVHKNIEIRKAVAKNKNTNTNTLIMLFRENEDERVFHALLDNPNLPDLLIQECLQKVRDFFAASNQHAPLHTLERLSASDNLHIRCRVASNPRTPLFVLSKLATDSEWYVRKHLASNPNLPFEIQDLLAKDVTSSVRMTLAQNPNTHGSILEFLAREGCEDYSILKSILQNVNTPKLCLEELSLHFSSEVRALVASNPKITLERLSFLSVDDDPKVRSNAVRNMCRDSSLRSSLVERAVEGLVRANSLRECEQIYDQNYCVIQISDLVRALVLLNLAPGLDEADIDMLGKGSRSLDWLTRLAVVLHPKISQGILNLLCHDGDPEVRGAARSAVNHLKQSTNQVKIPSAS